MEINKELNEKNYFRQFTLQADGTTETTFPFQQNEPFINEVE